MNSDLWNRTVQFIPVDLPPPGETTKIQAGSDRVLQFGAWLSPTALHADGTSLVIPSAGGGALVIIDFFADWPDNLPRMELAGRCMMDGQEFLERFAPDLLDAIRIKAMSRTKGAGGRQPRL